MPRLEVVNSTAYRQIYVENSPIWDVVAFLDKACSTLEKMHSEGRLLISASRLADLEKACLQFKRDIGILPPMDSG